MPYLYYVVSNRIRVILAFKLSKIDFLDLLISLHLPPPRYMNQSTRIHYMYFRLWCIYVKYIQFIISPTIWRQYDCF